jgi:hypothetical protein
MSEIDNNHNMTTSKYHNSDKSSKHVLLNVGVDES